mmetsp:Transcript_11153/g.24950  ORF Transcript_11153/g.24950 Transcript_11153/m.24950 type:complete len:244 (-) Transcript_11153:1136-1867(-)
MEGGSPEAGQPHRGPHGLRDGRAPVADQGPPGCGGAGEAPEAPLGVAGTGAAGGLCQRGGLQAQTFEEKCNLRRCTPLSKRLLRGPRQCGSPTAADHPQPWHLRRLPPTAQAAACITSGAWARSIYGSVRWRWKGGFNGSRSAESPNGKEGLTALPFALSNAGAGSLHEPSAGGRLSACGQLWPGVRARMLGHAAGESLGKEPPFRARRRGYRKPSATLLWRILRGAGKQPWAGSILGCDSGG